MKNDIIKFAKSIGIEYIGFGDIDFSSEFVKGLKERRENGHLSGFEEEDENKRVDIKTLLSDAKTIISIAIPYKTIEPAKDKPHFSKFSLGLDYHRILGEKLKLISEFLSENYNARSIEYCDIGPLSDREIAKKCGIGFYGKNTNIITKKYGSFVSLGEIITNIFIERDSLVVNDCGDCNLCINACPAKAIERPYYINAKKCLSFIGQKKDSLSNYEMDKLNLNIYGCDACQDVCPFNKGVSSSSIEEFIPNKWNIDVNEEKFLNMTNKEFKETFGRTSSGWRGKDILKRNLIIAMGNSRNKKYIPLLKNYKNEKLKCYIERSIEKLEDDGNEK